MKIAQKFKIVTVSGVYIPASTGLHNDPRGVAFYRDGVRRWDGKAIKRAARKADRRMGRTRNLTA